MESLHDHLDRILDQLVRLELPVATLLQPGLREEEIEALVEHLPFRIPRELYLLYQWRNGVSGDMTNAFFPGCYFSPLEGAIQGYYGAIQMAKDVTGSDEEYAYIWNPRWFPIFERDDAGYYVVVGQDEVTDALPIVHIDIEGAVEDAEYPSLTSMMQVLAECYETSAFTWNLGEWYGGYLQEDEAKVGEIRRKHALDQADAALGTLQYGPDSAGLNDAIRDVIDLRDARAVEPLIALLRSGSPAASSAILPLGLLGDARAIEPLLEVVRAGQSRASTDDPHATLWGLAAHLMNPQSNAQSLRRGQAIDAVDDLSSRLSVLLPVGPFLAALEDPVPGVRYKAAAVLGKIGGGPAVDALVATLRDPELSVRLAVVQALGATRDARALAPLLALALDIPGAMAPLIPLGDPQQAARPYALKALGALGDLRAVDPLLKLLSECPESAVLAATIEALGKLKASPAVDPITRFLQRGSGATCMATLDALAAIDDPRAADALVRFLLGNALLEFPFNEQFHAPAHYRRAIEALARWHDPRLSGALEQVLRRDATIVRRTIVIALQDIESPWVTDHLVRAAEDPEAEIRALAAEALGKQQAPQALDVLIGRLRDEDGRVRAAAARALGNQGQVQAVDPLIQTLADENRDVQIRAAHSLGRLNDARAIDALRGLAQTGDTAVQKASQQALKLMEPS